MLSIIPREQEIAQKTIIGYGRVSDRKQTDGLSLERQKARLKAAGCHDVFFDIESGRKDNRKNYTKIRKLIERGLVIELVAIRLDRLGRSITELSRLYKLCIDTNTNLKILDLGIELNSPFGKLIYTVLSALAEIESDNISRRVKDAWAYKRENAIAHLAPLGYKNNKGIYTVDIEEAKAIREILAIILKPTSASYAARYANTHFPNLLKERHGKKDRLWRRASIVKILRNPTLRGHTQFKIPGSDEFLLIRDTHEAILSEEEFIKLEQVLQNNHAGKSNSLDRPINVLQGLVKCDVCKAKCQIANTSAMSGGIRKYYRSFTCPNYLEGRCTNKKRISYKKLVTEITQALQTKSIEIADLAIDYEPPEQINPRELELRSQLESLCAIPNPTSYVQKAIDETKAELSALELDTKVKTDKKITRSELIQAMKDPSFFAEMNPSDLSFLFKEFISEIRISNGIIELITFKF